MAYLTPPRALEMRAATAADALRATLGLQLKRVRTSNVIPPSLQLWSERHSGDDGEQHATTEEAVRAPKRLADDENDHSADAVPTASGYNRNGDAGAADKPNGGGGGTGGAGGYSADDAAAWVDATAARLTPNGGGGSVTAVGTTTPVADFWYLARRAGPTAPRDAAARAVAELAEVVWRLSGDALLLGRAVAALTALREGAIAFAEEAVYNATLRRLRAATEARAQDEAAARGVRAAAAATARADFWDDIAARSPSLSLISREESPWIIDVTAEEAAAFLRPQARREPFSGHADGGDVDADELM